MTIKDRGRSFQEYADSGIIRRIKIGNTNLDSSVAILADLHATIVSNEGNLLIYPNVRIGQVFAVGPGKPYKIYMNISGTNGHMSDWQHQNDSSGVTTSYIDFSIGAPAGAANIGDAYNTWTSTAAGAVGLVSDIIIATYGGSAYILVDKRSPELNASWVSLGSRADFATSNEVALAIEETKSLSPNTLRQELNRILGVTDSYLQTGGKLSSKFTGIGDAGNIVALNDDGKIDVSLLNIRGTNYKGHFDITIVPGGSNPNIPNNLIGGDFITIDTPTGSAVDSNWILANSATLSDIMVNDILIYEEIDIKTPALGGHWHLINQPQDMKPFVRKSGNNSMLDDATIVWTKTTATTIIDGGNIDNSKIMNVKLISGTF